MGKPDSKPWTTVEIKKLRQLVEEQHLSARTIDNRKILPRHPFWSISRAITNYCDLSNRKNSISIKLAKSRRLSGEAREKFRQDVLQRIENESLTTIAASWNVSFTTIGRVCDEAGINSEKRAKLAAAPQASALIRAKQIKGRDAKYFQRRKERRTDFEIRAGWRLNREKGLKSMACSKCKLKLARDKEFFLCRKYNRVDGTVAEHYDSKCRICRAEVMSVGLKKRNNARREREGK